MMRAGIFGPSMSGKTTLAKSLSLGYWQKFKMRTLVLDPNGEYWGEHAQVFQDETKFWSIVWASERCIVIAEEASETINRDKELTAVFTRLRHKHHKLIVVGHSGASLLPVMRQQFDTLYLFLQSKKSAQNWCEDATCEELMESTRLKQFEFIHYERYKQPYKTKLKINS